MFGFGLFCQPLPFGLGEAQVVGCGQGREFGLAPQSGQINVTTWPLVQLSLGAKWVSSLPEVTPVSRAQSIAL